jgi:hypothetical protein
MSVRHRMCPVQPKIAGNGGSDRASHGSSGRLHSVLPRLNLRLWRWAVALGDAASDASWLAGQPAVTPTIVCRKRTRTELPAVSGKNQRSADLDEWLDAGQLVE